MAATRVRALLDAGRRVCLTGSNASLLGREMGVRLTGRHVSHETYPFSFREFLEYTGQTASAATLEDYLMRGGFAAALRAGPDQGCVLLRELLRDVVHRDIVTRHALRSARPLMTLVLHLLAHAGQPLSLQALAKGLGLPSVAQTARLAPAGATPLQCVVQATREQSAEILCGGHRPGLRQQPKPHARSWSQAGECRVIGPAAQGRHSCLRRCAA